MSHCPKVGDIYKVSLGQRTRLSGCIFLTTLWADRRPVVAVVKRGLWPRRPP